jgi:hypothetical protein
MAVRDPSSIFSHALSNEKPVVSDMLKEFLYSGVKLADPPKPEFLSPQRSSPEIQQPFASWSMGGSKPGPGEPYPFNFTFNYNGQSYEGGQASGLVASETTSPSPPSRAVYGTYAPPHTTPPNPPAYVNSYGAYLPDAYYGGDTNVPFPSYVPQLNFAPNHGREEEFERGRQTS